MLSPFPRCRRRVLPSSCPGAVDGGGGVGDGFRAVGASRGTEIAAGAGVGAEEAVFFALSLWLAVCSAISAVAIDLWLAVNVLLQPLWLFNWIRKIKSASLLSLKGSLS